MAKTIEDIEERDEQKEEDTIEYLSNYKRELENKTTDNETEHLYWRPLVDNLDPLNKHLKWILKKEGMLDDGSIHLTIRDIGFFKGLKAVGVQDAEAIIEAIQKYGYIEIFEQ